MRKPKGHTSVQTENQSGCDLVVLGEYHDKPQQRTGRRSDFTQAKADKFIAVLADSCNVSLAVRAIKRSIGNIYHHRQKDAEFRAAWDHALHHFDVKPPAVEAFWQQLARTVTLRGNRRSHNVFGQFNSRTHAERGQ